MAATASIDAIEWLRKQVEAAPDGLRTMLTEMVNVLMSAEIDGHCGAGYGERSDERMNSRNGYRPRPWDTRVGTIDLQIPKLRHGTYFPGWLLEPRRRAEKALTAVVAEAYLLGVSTREVEDLVQSLGIEKLSKSQVSQLSKELDGVVKASESGRWQAPTSTSGSTLWRWGFWTGPLAREGRLSTNARSESASAVCCRLGWTTGGPSGRESQPTA